MMLRLNFAPKLMLAMGSMVALVSAALFAVTRESLETAWNGMFEARFVSQAQSLTSLQKVRLENIEERCRELAASDTVINAMTSGEDVLPSEVRVSLLERARVVRDSATAFENHQNRRGPSPRGGANAGERPGPGDRPGAARGANPTGGPGSIQSVQRPGVKGASPGLPGPAGALEAGTGSGGSAPRQSTGQEGRKRWQWGRPDFLDIALIEAGPWKQIPIRIPIRHHEPTRL